MSFMPPYDVRASDLDRERAVEFLKAHYTDGRLAPDELAWRTDAAYRAVGLSELDRLTADLPALPAVFLRPAPRRRVSAVGVVLVAAVLVAALTLVPPEAWGLAFIAVIVLGVLALATFVLVAPIAVPVLLFGWIVHVIARAARPQPRPRHVGWR